jgi:epoxyqueuosine reductase
VASAVKGAKPLVGPMRPLAADERERIVASLRSRAEDPSPLVREHVQWALEAA